MPREAAAMRCQQQQQQQRQATTTTTRNAKRFGLRTLCVVLVATEAATFAPHTWHIRARGNRYVVELKK